MKRIAFVIMMLVSTLASQLEAKTIHWLTFIDTTDPNVGEVDLNTRNIHVGLMSLMQPLKSMGMT